MLSGKKILLGVCGSIAAYKSAYLVRLLTKANAEVKVVMTPAASSFITPLTLSVLSKNPVWVDFTGDKSTWNNHVALGLWADIMLMAPASANTIAKMANGLCDNLLLATYLSARCPVILAPAMDEDMWKHPSTQNNIRTLLRYGNKIIEVGKGELASGMAGEGRMAEPEHIMDFLKKELAPTLTSKKKLQGKKIIVTAGPTQEPIDPVRYISNHSSGKMGVSIANALADEGARVTLISGPIFIPPAPPPVQTVPVTTAREMYEACLAHFKQADAVVMAAAVADYTPRHFSPAKIKKNREASQLELSKTQDILKELGKRKKKNQLLVGFALETDDEMEHAKKKLKEKNLDCIILNSLNDEGAGFKYPTNKITMIDKYNNIKYFELKSKDEVARDIVHIIIQLFHE